MAKMGFEPNRRLVMDYKNKRVTMDIAGKTYTFRSILESKVAQYLQLLKNSGYIKDWAYEFMNFRFPDNSWLIDFTITENDGNFWHLEAKGYFQASDRKKLKMLYKYFPQARVLYVFQNKKDLSKMGLSKKYLWWREPVLLSDLTRGIV